MENKLLEWFGPDIAYFAHLNTMEKEVPAVVSARIEELLSEYGLKRHKADFLMFWRLSTMLSDLDEQHKARAKAITDSLKEWNANAEKIQAKADKKKDEENIARRIIIDLGGETISYTARDNIEEILRSLDLGRQRDTDYPLKKSDLQTGQFANGVLKYIHSTQLEQKHSKTLAGYFFNICGLIPPCTSTNLSKYETEKKFFRKMFEVALKKGN